ERGRVYPAGRQASAVTDLFRRELARLNVQVRTDACVEKMAFQNGFSLMFGAERVSADAVVLAAGGKAAPNFGTDGGAFSLAKAFGHTVTPLTPALVQLRCDMNSVRGLKGIRVDGGLCVVRRGEEIYRCRGDVLFTENGVSGDAVFRASSYAQTGDKLLVDLLPDLSEERLRERIDPSAGESCLLCVVNNGLGRTLFKRSAGDRDILVSLLKRYPLIVEGTLGFERAQVTRGGVPLRETDENFMSVKQAGLYFAGEILNADGECGGYNLQWAFTTAHCVSEGV
ncbi:MAG: aminoacetone oxidase family FAD-binding enzyme, partial [Clostridia bacterium]|nr:aminoacetone oxidase family FAD-binding enzyme [Clostridia bacterium]